MSSFPVAAVQMVSGADLDANLADAKYWIAHATKQGAKLVVLPEYFCLMGKADHDKVDIAEEYGNGRLQTFLAEVAREHSIWLVAGTIPLKAPSPSHIYNTTLVYNPLGNVVARYDKIHLFRFQKGSESYDEGRVIAAGSQTSTFEIPLSDHRLISDGDQKTLRVGLSICYDLRFPELFRQFGVLDLIILPAAFTATTGSAHWHTLLKARAIENQAYVIASAQGGSHTNGRQTYGHSLLIDPWGETVNELAQGPGVVLGTIKTDRIDQVRTQLPAIHHRKL